MKIRNSFVFLLMMLLLVSCDFSANSKPTETPIPTITKMVLPTATLTPVPSETPLPSETPSPTATATPSFPIVLPKDISINCRFGFGVEWAIVGSLLENQYATLLGRNLTSSWWYVTLDEGLETNCWVSADVTEASGNLGSIPVLDQSQAFATDLTVQNPETISAPGCLGPIQPLNLQGTIEANGPGIVSWHFESEQSGIISNRSTSFIEAGTKTVADSFIPPVAEGTYTIKLVVIRPNEIEAQASYIIECP